MRFQWGILNTKAEKKHLDHLYFDDRIMYE